MKKKLLTTLLAAVLCTPQVAFAARDGEGMQYTSASEGFYGSIRTQFTSNTGDQTKGAAVKADGSRLGVRGELDLGHGLTGLYRYEWEIFGDNGASPQGKTRLSYVGLRGGWGEFQAGSLWANDYNWTTAGTDIATTGSGNFAPVFRVKNAIQYQSPDINGFQASFRLGMDGAGENDSTANIDNDDVVRYANILGRENPVSFTGVTTVGITSFRGTAIQPILGLIVNVTNVRATAPIVVNGTTTQVTLSQTVTNNNIVAIGVNGDAKIQTKGSENLDAWALAAKYATHGFTFGASYEVQPEQRGYVLGRTQSMVEVSNIQLDIASTVVATMAAGGGASNDVTLGNINGGTTMRLLPSTVSISPKDEDNTFWAIRLGYGQDNWAINGWYGERNSSDHGAPADILGMKADESAADKARREAAIAKNFNPQDTEIFSLAGNIDLGKIALVAIYETQENEWALEDSVFILNADYNFTSQSKAYIAYIANDFDSNPDKDDEVRIGLRMDF